MSRFTILVAITIFFSLWAIYAFIRGDKSIAPPIMVFTLAGIMLGMCIYHQTWIAR